MNGLLPGREVRVEVVAVTDPGQRRSENQDQFLVADLSHRDPNGPLLHGGDDRPGVHGPEAFSVGELGGLLLVCDGMGGAAGGATASGMAIRVIHGMMSTQWATERRRIPVHFARHMAAALEQANTLIYDRSRRETDLGGMGTTATAVGVLDTHLLLGQVGDSRAYLFRQGVLTQLTRDQSVVQMLRESGALAADEVRTDRRSNLILQALGSTPKVTVDLTHQSLREGDVALLCSDGLSGEVDDVEIGRILSRPLPLESIGQELVDLANARGGPDNITVILARFEGDALSPPVDGELVRRNPMALEGG
ncbi:MAG: protein phosphatase 2C domain-containing protein [Gemmatimonadetes bacterium]|nr:protein phosphatase 2C domain-containing protein [Gemmatimonadota bacterium]